MSTKRKAAENDLDYDERVTAPETDEDDAMERVLRALMDVPPSRVDQATSDDSEDTAGR